MFSDLGPVEYLPSRDRGCPASGTQRVCSAFGDAAGRKIRLFHL